MHRGTVTLLYIFLLIVPAIIVGMLIGYSLRSGKYDGVIKMIEDEKGLIYSLELDGDPENLIFQKDVRFKVMPPNYEDLQELLDNKNQSSR